MNNALTKKCEEISNLFTKEHAKILELIKNIDLANEQHLSELRSLFTYISEAGVIVLNLSDDIHLFTDTLHHTMKEIEKHL